LSKLALKENQLTSEEAASARSILVFALIGLISVPRQKCWLNHVEYAAGYYEKNWNAGKN